MERVSVVIPCYNYGRFLSAAIGSVLAQRYLDIQLIVIDDGSRDETPAVAARYPTATYVYQRNLGVSKARNRGTALSDGEFILFLDADDQLATDAIATSARVLAQRPECAFVYGHQQLVDEEGSPLSTMPERTAMLQGCLEEDPFSFMLRRNFPLRNPGAILYRKEIIDRLGGFTDAFRDPTTQDLDLNFRIAREYPICCNDRVVMLSRIHSSMSTLNAHTMLRDTVRAQQRQRRFVREHRTYMAQYKAGLKLARGYWGRKLTQQVIADSRRRAIRALARDLLILLRFAPGVGALTLAHRVRARAAGRP